MTTLPAWPESLGLPLNAGYSHTVSAIAPIPMTAGVGRVRRTLETPVSEFSTRFLWTHEQLEQYRQFARHEIDGTAGWFMMALWSGGSIELQRVRIKSVSQYQLQMPYWSVSLELECPDRFLLDDETGDVLLDWDAEDLINAGQIAEQSLCDYGQLFACSMTYRHRFELAAGIPQKFSNTQLSNVLNHYLQIEDDCRVSVRVTLALGEPLMLMGKFNGPGFFSLMFQARQAELVSDRDAVVILAGH